MVTSAVASLIPEQRRAPARAASFVSLLPLAVFSLPIAPTGRTVRTLLSLHTDCLLKGYPSHFYKLGVISVYPNKYFAISVLGFWEIKSRNDSLLYLLTETITWLCIVS